MEPESATPKAPSINLTPSLRDQVEHLAKERVALRHELISARGDAAFWQREATQATNVLLERGEVRARYDDHYAAVRAILMGNDMVGLKMNANDVATVARKLDLKMVRMLQIFEEFGHEFPVSDYNTARLEDEQRWPSAPKVEVEIQQMWQVKAPKKGKAKK